MARGHPVDALGRVLPTPGWPGDRTAPGALELVRRFCNSSNRENGAERFLTPAAFDDWLVTEDEAATGATPADLRRVLVVRDVLHDLVIANATDRDARADWQRLARRLSASRLAFTATGDGLATTPGGHGVDAFLAGIGSAVADAVRDGTWPRLKACRNCHWVVFDPSKNRSVRWCSMSACGGRHNAREYRRRRSVG